MQSFTNFLNERAEVNFGISLGSTQIFGQKHKIYLSKHTTFTRDQERRHLLSNERTVDVVSDGLEKWISKRMGPRFARAFDTKHDQIIHEEENSIHPYKHPITIYYPVKAATEVYMSETRKAFENSKDKEKYSNLTEFIRKEFFTGDRYNMMVVQMSTPENSDILSQEQKRLSNQRKSTWVIGNNKRYHFFDHVTVVTSICNGINPATIRGGSNILEKLKIGYHKSDPRNDHRLTLKTGQRDSPIEYDIVIMAK